MPNFTSSSFRSFWRAHRGGRCRPASRLVVAAAKESAQAPAAAAIVIGVTAVIVAVATIAEPAVPIVVARLGPVRVARMCSRGDLAGRARFGAQPALAAHRLIGAV